MSLVISGSEAYVKNRQGQVKFTTAARLAYLKHRQQGTVTIGGGHNFVPFPAPARDDIFQISVRFVSQITPELQAYGGMWVNANAPIVIRTMILEGPTFAENACEWEWLSVLPTAGSLVFAATRMDVERNVVGIYHPITLNYKAALYGTL